MTKSMRQTITVSLNEPAIFSPSFQRRVIPKAIKDPCDFVIAYGGEAFKVLVNKAEHIIDYKFTLIVAETLEADPAAFAAACEKAICWFAQYIHHRSDLEPDHPALITPPMKGAIIMRLSKLSGMNCEEVRQIMNWKTSQLPPIAGSHLKLTGFPTDPKARQVVDQLEHVTDTAGLDDCQNEIELHEQCETCGVDLDEDRKQIGLCSKCEALEAAARHEDDRYDAWADEQALNQNE